VNRSWTVGRRLLVAASLGYIAYLLRHADRSFRRFHVANAVSIAAGFALMLGAVWLMSNLWIRLVSLRIGPGTIPDHKLRQVFSRSWIARYLPGSAWAYGARVLHTDSQIARRPAFVVTLLDEVWLSMGSSVALGAGLWTWATLGTGPGIIILVLVATAIGAASRYVASTARVVNKPAVRRLLRRWPSFVEKLREGSELPRLSASAVLVLTFGYIVVGAAGGATFLLLAKALVRIPLGQAPLLMGAYNLSVVVGMIAIFAPAGIGVREAVLAGLLSGSVSSSTVILAALGLRGLTLVSDLAFFGLNELFARGRRISKHSPEGVN
jgi:uncharacterized membrane protein YbhN (UPF0104 family)